MDKVNSSVHSLIQQYEKEMIAFRRELHEYPELSFEEVETTNRIAKQLDLIGISYKRLEPTGILAEINGQFPGKTLLLRADIDALPVKELNDSLAYKSKHEGKMHACGHDAHASMLLTAAKAIYHLREELHGTVRLVFQPAEELGKGAKHILTQGVADAIDSVFGIHIWSGLEVGKVSCPAGPSFAAADLLEIDFTGQGGHAAMPHQTVDAAVMASQFVSNLQSIVAREIDPLYPAVITIGTMDVGDKANIIAEHAHLEGTIRSFDDEARDTIERATRQYAEHIALMYGGTVHINYERMTEGIINEEISAALVRKTASEAFGDQVLKEEPPTMGAEDFGFYMKEAPGAFALVGSGNPDKETHFAHHHGRFNIDEEALKVGAELYAQYAFAYLTQK